MTKQIDKMCTFLQINQCIHEKDPHHWEKHISVSNTICYQVNVTMLKPGPSFQVSEIWNLFLSVIEKFVNTQRTNIEENEVYVSSNDQYY